MPSLACQQWSKGWHLHALLYRTRLKCLHLLGCVNMLQWRIIPGSAFPIARWAAGSGSIYCDGGQYCPNTTTSLGCPRGHFCRQGEWEPARCPPGATCPPNTEVFEANYTGGFCCMVAWVVKLLQMLAGQLSQAEGSLPSFRFKQLAHRSILPVRCEQA